MGMSLMPAWKHPLPPLLNARPLTVSQAFPVDPVSCLNLPSLASLCIISIDVRFPVPYQVYVLDIIRPHLCGMEVGSFLKQLVNHSRKWRVPRSHPAIRGHPSVVSVWVSLLGQGWEECR